MDEATQQARADALAFLKRQKTGVLATVSESGEAHATMVYYSVDDNFNLYFLTPANTRKYANITAHPQVAFVVSTQDVPQTVQFEGVAMDISLDQEAGGKKEELFKILNSNPWFYEPIAKLDIADTIVVWVRPLWVRWADYAFAESGSAHVFKEIPLS